MQGMLGTKEYLQTIVCEYFFLQFLWLEEKLKYS